MTRLNRNALGTVAMAALLAIGMAPGAKAGTISGWNFDLSNAGSGTFTGLGTATNVKLLDLAGGTATILQTLSGGSPVNQPFTETGTVAITDYLKVGALLPTGLPLGNATDAFFTFNLSGKVVGAGENVFFTGGSATLYLENDADLNPATGTVQKLAVFDLIPGASGTSLGGNNIPSGSLQLAFKEDPASPVTDLFSKGAQTLDGFAFELVNVQPVLDTDISPNPSITGNTETIVVTDEGQLKLAVPEPGSMLILGSALLGFGFVSRKRRKNQA